MPRIGLLLAIGGVCLLGMLDPILRAGESQKPDELARYDKRIKPADRQHWAYQPVKKPMPPSVKQVDWIRNPIDAFVLHRLERKGWKPAPAAEPRAWLRRVHL